MTWINVVHADNTAFINANDTYINSRNFLQNPYVSLPSEGGIQTLVESQVANQNIMEKWFADGTWNVLGTASFNINGGLQPNYEYGANIFAQTGQVAGFSFGGLLTVINPYFSNQMNPPPFSAASNQFLPSTQQVSPAEAFAEYQYANRVQLDAGYIGIINDPWLGANYYNNMAAPALTYQGAEANVNAGGGWILSALTFNAAQPSGQVGFDGLTFYNKGFNWGNPANFQNNTPSHGTYALGANFMGWNNNENLRIWYNNFQDYSSMIYADNSIKLVASPNLTFNLGLQGGYEQGNANDIIATNGLGNINSTFYGAQAGFNYKWFGLNFAFDNSFGPSNSFGQGAIVSPYTYSVALDPLYTTPYMSGLVDRASGGQAYKISPSFTFLNGSLSFTPAATFLQTVAATSSQEYDFVASYSIPQIKGLTLFAAYGYYSTPFTPTTPGGDTYTFDTFVSYLY